MGGLACSLLGEGVGLGKQQCLPHFKKIRNSNSISILRKISCMVYMFTLSSIFYIKNGMRVGKMFDEI